MPGSQERTASHAGWLLKAEKLVPSRQDVHVRGRMEVGDCSTAVPGAQVAKVRQLLWSASGWYSSSVTRHGSQRRLLVGVRACSSKVPASQVGRAASQLGWPSEA